MDPTTIAALASAAGSILGAGGAGGAAPMTPDTITPSASSGGVSIGGLNTPTPPPVPVPAIPVNPFAQTYVQPAAGYQSAGLFGGVSVSEIVTGLVVFVVGSYLIRKMG